MKQIILLILVIIPLYGYGQGVNQWRNILNNATDYGKSPEVAAMERYGTYPVDHGVGIPDITIPIYTINTGKLEFPISLSYHLGGVRVDDIATWTGLGWTLKAGGSISREMRGKPDETGWLDKSSMTFTNAYTGNKVRTTVPVPDNLFMNFSTSGDGVFLDMMSYFDALSYNSIDSQADIYSYNANSISGSFTYDTDRKPVKVPYSDNQIIRNANNTFTIVSDDGTRYNFNDTERRVVVNSAGSADYISNWLLSEIVSADAIDTIRFKYTTDLYLYDESRSSATVSEGYYLSGDYVSSAQDANQIERSNTTITSKERLLTSIIFRDGSVEFERNPEKRKDKRDYSLRSITVKNKNGVQVKKVTFEYSYFASNGSSSSNKNDFRLKLDRLKIWGKDNNIPPLLYIFTYNTDVILPAHGNYGQDHWGYYNGVKTNTHLVGVMPSTSKSLSTKANREPSAQYMKACILTQIDYPTGGYSVFETEPNISDDGKQMLGGLRIAKIISKSNNTDQAITTVYKYEGAENIYFPDPDQYTFKMGIHTAHMKLDIAGLVPRTFYTETPFSGLGYYKGSSVLYKKVTKYETDGSKNNGKTVYTYGAPSNFSYSTRGGVPAVPYVENKYMYCKVPRSWATGQILKEEYYHEGLSTPIKTISYEYSTYTGNEPLIGKSASYRYITTYVEHISAESYKDAKNYYEYYWIYTSTGYQKLKKTTETLYDNTTKQYTTQVTEFDYGIGDNLSPRNLLLTKKTSYVNGNEKLTETYKYPQDFPSTAVYKDMVIKNILSVPIEAITHKNTLEISKNKREFGYFPSIQPASDQSSTGGSAYRTDITYDLYDHRGNIRQYTLMNGISGVLLWSYRGRYPVVEIKNAVYSDVTKVISDATIKSITDKTEPSATDWQAINGLKTNTNLAKAHVSVYNYEPLGGVLTATTPGEITSYYSYDEFSRLIEARNTDKRIQAAYQYQYTGKPFPPISFTLGAAPEYPISKRQTIYATASGGSDNFEYSWTLKNASGTVVSTVAYNTGNSFSYEFAPAVLGTAMTLTAQVRDTHTDRTVTASKIFNVVKPYVEFSNQKSTGGGYGSTSQNITADINCYEQVTARFRIRTSMSTAGAVNISYIIAGKYYQRSYNCDETVDIVIPKGINSVELRVNKNNSSVSSYASLAIEKIVSNNNSVGSDNTIYVY